MNFFHLPQCFVLFRLEREKDSHDQTLEMREEEVDLIMEWAKGM